MCTELYAQKNGCCLTFHENHLSYFQLLKMNSAPWNMLCLDECMCETWNYGHKS
jgi:hypothetical protein